MIKLQWKNSTKVLAFVTTVGAGVWAWVADPQNQSAIQRLLQGHQRALVVLGGVIALYNLLHDPKKPAAGAPKPKH